MANQSNILKDLARYLPEVVVPTVIAFISVPVYTRLFDPAAYGNFNIARVTNMLLERCCSWIGSSVTRYYHEYEKEQKLGLLVTTLIKMLVVVSLITNLLVFALIQMMEMSDSLRLLLEIGIILFGVSLASSCLRNILRMQRRIIMHSIFVMLSSVFSFVISLLLIMKYNLQIESIFIGNLVIAIILLPVLWRVSVLKLFKMRQRVDTQIIRKFAVYGIPLTIGYLGGWALDFSDRYIIKWLLDSHEVGVYSACYNVTWNSLYLIVNLFYMMEEPLAMKVYVTEGREALSEFLNQETRLYLLIFMPFLFLMCCYSQEILSIMVSDKYHAGKGIIPYVAISTFIAGLIFKYRLGIMAMERTRSLMMIIVSVGILNVLLNILLISLLGIIGAAVATMSAYGVYFTMMFLVSRKIFPWRFPVRSLLKITLAAALSIYPLSLLVTANCGIYRLLLHGTASFGIYATLLYVLNEVKPVEARAFLQFIVTRLNLKSKNVGMNVG